MNMKLKDLRALNDHDLENRYDIAAPGFPPGISYWRDEMDRRSRERLIRSNRRIANTSLVVAMLSGLASIVSVAIALLR